MNSIKENIDGTIIETVVEGTSVRFRVCNTDGTFEDISKEEYFEKLAASAKKELEEAEQARTVSNENRVEYTNSDDLSFQEKYDKLLEGRDNKALVQEIYGVNGWTLHLVKPIISETFYAVGGFLMTKDNEVKWASEISPHRDNLQIETIDYKDEGVEIILGKIKRLDDPSEVLIVDPKAIRSYNLVPKKTKEDMIAIATGSKKESDFVGDKISTYEGFVGDNPVLVNVRGNGNIYFIEPLTEVSKTVETVDEDSLLDDLLG